MMFLPAKSSAPEAIFDAIQSDCFDAMERFGQAEAEAWQERVAVPVQYVTGPGGGAFVIRSRPGEPPRRETSNLHDSIEAVTEADADVVTTTVASDVNYGLYLQDGTDHIARRPHAPDPDEILERLADAIVAAIEGR